MSSLYISLVGGDPEDELMAALEEGDRDSWPIEQDLASAGMVPTEGPHAEAPRSRRST